MRYKILDGNGDIIEEELPISIAENISILSYSPNSYFNTDGEFENISLECLVSARARPDGILNANLLMKEAANDLRPKRSPLKVSFHENGVYLVNDGNSTLMNARFSGWPDIPCIIV